MNLQSVARALVECELIKCKVFNQDDNKNKFLLGEARASVARNLRGVFWETLLTRPHLLVLLLLKGMVK